MRTVKQVFQETQKLWEKRLAKDTAISLKFNTKCSICEKEGSPLYIQRCEDCPANENTMGFYCLNFLSDYKSCFNLKGTLTEKVLKDLICEQAIGWLDFLQPEE